mgnify:CR=1 FL=1
MTLRLPDLPVAPPLFPLDQILIRVQEELGRRPAWHPLQHWQAPSTRRRDARPGVHPSDLDRDCNRAITYALVGAPRGRQGLSPLEVRRFDHGSVIHAQVQGYLIEAAALGLLDFAKVEVEVNAPWLGIDGTTDAIIGHGGYVYDVEVKSAGPETYYGSSDLKRATRIITTPSASYRKQVHAYMAGTGLRMTAFIYFDKAMDDVKVIWVPFDDTLWTEIRREIEHGQEMVRLGALPGKTTKLYQCPRCPFKDICDKETGLRGVADLRNQATGPSET